MICAHCYKEIEKCNCTPGCLFWVHYEPGALPDTCIGTTRKHKPIDALSALVFRKFLGKGVTNYMNEQFEVIFEEPATLTRNGNSRNYREVLSGLVQYPEQWARIATFERPSSANTTAASLNSNNKKQNRNVVPEGRWEFTSRKLQDGRGGVYARYMGR